MSTNFGASGLPAGLPFDAAGLPFSEAGLPSISIQKITSLG